MNPLPARLWGKLLEPKTQVEPSRQPFSNQDLKQLIVPLFVEQLLAMLVGIADTLMVSYAGEAAVSGVSLVNMLNTFFIFLFTALASGGAVVVSQYIGSRDGANSNLAAGQLYTLSFLCSLVCMAATLVWNRPLLGLLFGQVEPDVMEASAIYLRISAYSYPFLALYNAGAALYRCMSKTKVTMQISLVMNAINVAGNAIGIFVLHAGVAGVAWPSTLSRAFAAVAMTALCFSQKNQVRLLWKDLLTWNSSMVRRLLRIAVPNSIENGLFQLAKVALSSITAMFGTVQIAANGVAQSIWSLAVYRRIVVFVMEAVGVHEVRVGCADGSRFLIHKIHISIHAAGNVNGNGHSRVISGVYHKSIEKLPKGELVSRNNICHRGIRCDVIALLPYGHHIVQISVFQSHETGHDFCQTGWIHPLMNRLCVERFMGVLAEQSGCAGCQGNLVGVIIFIRHAETAGETGCLTGA